MVKPGTRYSWTRWEWRNPLLNISDLIVSVSRHCGLLPVLLAVDVTQSISLLNYQERLNLFCLCLLAAIIWLLSGISMTCFIGQIQQYETPLCLHHLHFFCPCGTHNGPVLQLIVRFCLQVIIVYMRAILQLMVGL